VFGHVIQIAAVLILIQDWISTDQVTGFGKVDIQN